MSIFFTSDTHFNNDAIIEYDQRPFKDSREMNATLIQNWNRQVDSTDLIYHLGDFGVGSIRDLREIFECLNGKITLIRGHNERSFSKLLQIGFSGVADEIILNQEEFILVMSFEPCVTRQNIEGLINLHSYTNSRVKFNKNYANVSTGVWDYTPVLLEDLILDYKKHRRSTP